VTILTAVATHTRAHVLIARPSGRVVRAVNEIAFMGDVRCKRGVRSNEKRDAGVQQCVMYFEQHYGASRPRVGIGKGLERIVETACKSSCDGGWGICIESCTYRGTRANRSHSCQLNASKAEAAILFWSMNELASSLDLTMLSNFLTITLVQDTSCHYDQEIMAKIHLDG